jgi:putative CocE/NonD family hydrolase
VILFCATHLPAASLPPPILKRLNARVVMRDGIALSANVFRPDVKSRVPTVLIRTPYGKGSDLPLGYQPFLDRGYALVMQDVRGRYASEGSFRPLSQE